MSQDYTVVAGKKITSRWGQWYRHDTVKVGETVMEGVLQTRRRYYGKRIGHRFETSTCFRGSAVIGHAVDWLIRQNALAENPAPQS